MFILAHYPSGRAAVTLPLNLALAPQAGDVLRVNGSSFKVLHRRFANAMAPDAGVTLRQWILLLTVEDYDDKLPMPDVITDEA